MMTKYKALRVFHVLTMFFAICVFAALALYTYDEVWFVGVSELVFYVLFDRAAELADNWEALWPTLILITIGLLIIEETLYKKIYIKAMHPSKRRHIKHGRDPKLLYEDDSVDEKAIRKEEKEKQKALKEKLAAEKKLSKMTKNEPEQQIETPQVKPVVRQSAQARLNEMLKNRNKQ